ncbi:MAG: hypothetical protein HY757_06390 [Nitrospirae bacterium]|nr:hypothetical protein [Nitrospirota bacterium]
MFTIQKSWEKTNDFLYAASKLEKPFGKVKIKVTGKRAAYLKAVRAVAADKGDGFCGGRREGLKSRASGGAIKIYGRQVTGLAVYRWIISLFLLLVLQLPQV